MSVETQLRIKNLMVGVWPEYDDPRVLVIYRGEFVEGPAFPAWVDFYIPDNAEVIGAGIGAPDGQLLNQEFNVYRIGERNIISINLSQPRFFMEYYYSPFSGGGALKLFEQKLENKYPVERMKVEIQQPLKAEEFTVNPAPESSFKDAMGFSYSNYSFNNLGAEKSSSFTVSYKKEDPNPSVMKKVQVRQGDSEPKPAGERRAGLSVKAGKNSRFIAGMLILISVAAVVSVALVKRNADRRAVSQEEPGKQTAHGQRWNFCPHCGASLNLDYSFCPACGNKVIGGK